MDPRLKQYIQVYFSTGQVGGGLYTHSGGSVNYICLPNNPDATQPLKQHSHYAFLYGGEYEIFDFNQPQGIRSGIAQQDVACAACLVKGKMSSIMIPGRKTCYNGWTKEYDGLLMAGHPSHKAGSEYACVDSSTEVIAGGSSDQNGILFYPVKTVCGSLKCPPYTADTDVPCQVGGGHYSHSGASVNYICLPNDPDVAQPLKSHDSYAYLHGAEYEVFDYNTPQGIRSGIGQHDVACAACLAKEKTSSIMKPVKPNGQIIHFIDQNISGRKTCYNGWTKEYEGILMAGYHSHAAASEFACEDRDAEAKAGGSKDENGILFYPVKTQCGSLNCPPYKHDTEVLCVICSK
ncbi:uncharacterized protein [Mytilus edulis]|uniref:uncharacterized protein n=1 Tax=Mytilus edulis TaxID=6550 RepID=UPI0039F0144D